MTAAETAEADRKSPKSLEATRGANDDRAGRIPRSDPAGAIRRRGRRDGALVAQFEPFILRVVRFRMRHRGDYDRLTLRVGSIDVCQSVFKSLFARLKAGRFDLNQPKDMEKLLSAMIRFKIANKARKLSVVWREVQSDPGPGERVEPPARPREIG